MKSTIAYILTYTAIIVLVILNTNKYNEMKTLHSIERQHKSLIRLDERRVQRIHEIYNRRYRKPDIQLGLQ